MNRRFKPGLAAALITPVLLTGCGLPVGIQVASLFADGVSYLTTEKTLTEHGISAVAQKDCSVWRGLQGEEMCQDVPADAATVAEAEPVVEDAGEELWRDGGEIEVAEVSKAAKPWPAPKIRFAEPVAAASAPAASTPAKSADPVDSEFYEPPKIIPVQASFDPAAEVALQPAPVAIEVLPAPPSTDASNVAAPSGQDMEADATALIAAAVDPAPVVVSAPTQITPPTTPSKPSPTAKAGTFYVIASYRRLPDAQRFLKSQNGLGAQVIGGKVTGRPVYRIAIGPVARAERGKTRRRLVQAGFADTWAVRLKTPTAVTELASLN